jgi:hypothetical protein
MWINRTPVPIILEGNMSVQMKPRFIRYISQMRVNFTVMNLLQKSVAQHALHSPRVAEVEAASSLCLVTILRRRSLVQGVSVIFAVFFLT